MLLLIIVLILLFGMGGFYGHANWGPSFGYGFGGIGVVLLIVLLFGLRYIGDADAAVAAGW